MATINHIKTPDGTVHNIGGGGGSVTYTLTKSGSTITLTGSGGDVSSVTDANTTYSLSLSGDTLTLTPSSGSAQSVTIPDTDTTYTISVSGSTITLTPSSGSAQSITIPDATTSTAGVMSAPDKTKLDGIQSGAEANVQSDWNQSNNTADDFIKNKPTIPTVNNGTLTIQQNGTTLDTFTANQSGNTTVNITTSAGSQNVWYGSSSTAASTNTKVVTTSSGDFALTTGNMVFVQFSHENTASMTSLNVDGTGTVIVVSDGMGGDPRYMWDDGELVGFAYDGTYFVMVEGGVASTSTYGVTKLSSSVSSSATDVAATPSAVKQAYDLADSKSIVSVTQTLASGTKIAEIDVDGVSTDLYAPSGGGGGVTDVEVNGTSVVTGGVAQVTVPTATSDLVNDSGFIAEDANGDVEITGKIYKNSTNYIGQSYSNTKDSTNITAGDTVLGASISLPAGTYIVTGEWHYTSTSSSACSIGVALGTSSGQTNISETRVYQPSAWYQTLNTSMTTTLSSATTLYVRGMCSIARSGCWSQITAVRIA